ncbi:hypothetical protein SAMN05444161_8593 [Rhizobiales bacterium GAS191]|nr:hypothetical protein SAMN05444161_8593 [Rhizobiales bacterium GAS191]
MAPRINDAAGARSKAAKPEIDPAQFPVASHANSILL